MGVVMMEWAGPGEKGVRAGESTEVVEEVVSSRFNFSLSPEEEELPILARDTRPFLLIKPTPLLKLLSLLIPVPVPYHRYR
jgi:hypothetical protein